MEDKRDFKVVIIVDGPTYMNKEGKDVKSITADINGKKLYYAPAYDLLPSQMYPGEKSKAGYGDYHYPTQEMILRKQEQAYAKDNMFRKYVYPEVKVLCEEGGSPRNNLELETYIRLKHRGKYYLCKVWMQSEITTGIEAQLELIVQMKRFYEHVYKYQLMMKVDLNMVIAHFDPPKPVFELDKDQIDEKERLLPTSNYDPDRYTKR